MPATFMNFLRAVVLLFAFLQINHFSFSQTSSYPYQEWVKKLSDKNARALSGIYEVSEALKGKDPSEAITILNNLESKGSSAGNYFAPRFFLAKAIWIWSSNLAGKVDSTQQLVKKALNSAYETDNDTLVSAIGWQYSNMMYWTGLIEPAAMYALYSAENRTQPLQSEISSDPVFISLNLNRIKMRNK